MILNDYYKDLKVTITFKDIKTNSKEIEPGDLFIAIKGKTYDGHDFINEALEKKAAFIIAERMIVLDKIMIVDNTRDELFKLLTFFYKYDSLRICGITGTDGKTTTALILYHIFNFNSSSSYIGTNGIKTAKRYQSTSYTTPPACFLYQTLYNFNNKGIKTCMMEVSSEGLINNRVKGINFDGAIYTNLSHEHLNTHKNMKNYFNSKMILFKSLPSEAIAVINADDKYYKKIKTKATIITYGINKGTYRAINISLYDDHSEFDFYYKDKYLARIYVRLFGMYNIYNTLAAITYAYENGIPIHLIKSQLLNMMKIDGRFEQYCFKNKSFIIDFAHTPNGLYNLLSNLKQIKKKRIILILGCAGEKDSSKRHDMATIACKYSDIAIFTSEDPKNESILSILSDMTYNLKYDNYYLSFDRKEAIRLGCKIAGENDIVVITGKGDERYENIKGVMCKHNDLETIKEALGNS
ncbi:MAG: UDP-N-acetylmuramoyl-L-alanyl-D-glutamate--2,6-diaminopimelate ligase [Anaeroplasmataceae bacterium]